MKSEKQSFLFYYEWYENFLCNMTDEEAGRLVKAVCDYEIYGAVPDKGSLGDRLVNSAFLSIKSGLERNREKYKERCWMQGLKASAEYVEFAKTHGENSFKLFVKLKKEQMKTDENTCEQMYPNETDNEREPDYDCEPDYDSDCVPDYDLAYTLQEGGYDDFPYNGIETEC